MGEVKGTVVAYVRREIDKKGEAAVRGFFDVLKPDTRTVFKKAMPISWVPMAQVAEILEKAGPVLFPGNAAALHLIGGGEATDNLNGIYKMLVRVMSVPAVIAQASRIWTTYHNEGTGHAASTGADKKGAFWVEHYAQMPETFREFMCGYIARVIEMSGAKHVRVAHDSPAPDTWRWTATWD